MAERRARSAPRPPWRVQLRLHPATPLRAGEGEVPGVERAAPKQRRPPMKGDRSMTKVALYARYSSDNQSVASIDDQFRVCREYAAREKWRVVGAYKDPAISGASVTLRPGVQALLQDAQRGKFEDRKSTRLNSSH